MTETLVIRPQLLQAMKKTVILFGSKYHDLNDETDDLSKFNYDVIERLEVELNALQREANRFPPIVTT